MADKQNEKQNENAKQEPGHQIQAGRQQQQQQGLRQQQPGQRGQQGLSRRDYGGMARSQGTLSPFGLMRRMMEDMDRMFDDFVGGRGYGGRELGSFGEQGSPFGRGSFSPQIEVVQRDNKLAIRADLPGMRQEDLQIRLDDDSLVISGERRDERDDQRGDVTYSERVYGQFTRVIPLPVGVQPDQITASFEHGVLEIEVPLPRQSERGRNIQIGSSRSGNGGGRGGAASS